ncbi:MAG: 2-amino-4-hydroxy-6-hydroxymethyldihydropteridine diphosphokinase [Sedimentisphaerales bacterium]|nr:2-amino-4-hydroxy-6-hydroxymethyldihydropteridine diphosphokinase [Sedimentisphaerales bacterium]
MPGSTTAYIGLGSNLGDRERTIRHALEMLSGDGCIEVTRVSDVKETTPLGQMDQPDYLNGVAEIRTRLTPHELIQRLKATEAALGRRPASKWQARPIDLDLLLFGDQVIDASGLVVPHPEMHLRSFVLDGLCQLNPELVHPLLKEPVSELAGRLGGGNFLIDPDAVQLVSVAGVIGVGKTTLAKKLAEVLRGEVLYEPYGTNPFLPQVYAGKCELALDSQLYFLVNRTEQIDRDTLPPKRVFVTDYVFDKELIYARRLLNPEQLKLYETIFRPFAARVATPSLVVYLQDSPKACLERIRNRNRPYEQRISLEFLEGLDDDYRKLFAGWKVSPVICIPAPRLTGYNQTVVEHVALQVRAYIVAGGLRGV